MRLASTLELQAGGPGSGCSGPNCGRPEVYHGTLGKLAGNIFKNGLKPGGAKLGSARVVWATKDLEEALGYGISRVQDSKKPDQIALIVVDPKKAGFTQAYKDMNMQYVVSKGVVPESIKRIEIYDFKELYNALNDYRDIDTLQRSKGTPLPKPVKILKAGQEVSDEVYITLVPGSGKR